MNTLKAGFHLLNVMEMRKKYARFFLANYFLRYFLCFYLRKKRARNKQKIQRIQRFDWLILIRETFLEMNLTTVDSL